MGSLQYPVWNLLPFKFVAPLMSIIFFLVEKIPDPMARISIFVVFASYFAVSLALECWKCDYQSAEDCIKNGKIEKCSGGDQGTCQTEVRPDNGKTLVRTGCKQRNACSNNYNQNKRKAWSPTQCNKKGVSSICRCCCSEDGCNKEMAETLCEQRIQTPTEAPKKCLAPPEAPINGVRNCRRNYQPGSYCIFKCNDGYQLKGDVMTKCVENENGNGYGWDNETPTCEPEGEISDICPIPPQTPKNAKRDCKGNRKIRSYCNFSCDDGYVMHGQSRVTCKPTSSSGLIWTPQTPTCEPPICEPLPTKPINGDSECNGEGELGTKCEFTCNTGYYMIGHENTVCERTLLSIAGADWSNPTPICKKVQCAFLPKTPRNGYKECSSGHDLGSVCGFACFRGYELAGYPATTCRRDENDMSKADWDQEVPTCERLPVCDALPKKPTNGDRTCTGRGKIGARCDFNCNDGFVLIGHDHTICDKTASAPTETWNNPTPTCIEVQCEFLPKTPQNGNKNCSSGRDLGSVCDFTCIEGYTLTGYRSTTCRRNENDESKADWDQEEPTCKLQCDFLPKTPQNGNKKCSSGRDLGSVCDFTCIEGYTLTGYQSTTCRQNENDESKADWDQEEPTCKFTDPACPHIGNLDHGKIHCNRTDPYLVGTHCKFQCTKPKYTLIPKKRSEVVCQKDKTWSSKPCCVDCSQIKRDVIIGLDVSSSINKKQFRDMKTFLRGFVSKFAYGNDASLFIIFQFGAAAQAAKGLKKFDLEITHDKLLELVKRMKRLPGVGRSTMTGLALKFAHDQFKEDSGKGNRESVKDLLFILTDGRVNEIDKNNMLERAEQLRDDGVEIMAVAIGTDEEIKKEMIEVTGNEDNVFNATSFTELTEGVADSLFSKTCEETACNQQ